jgi:nitrate reductase NapE component
VDMGPVQISHKQTKTVPISPILSTVALVGGIGLVVVGVRAS